MHDDPIPTAAAGPTAGADDDPTCAQRLASMTQRLQIEHRVTQALAESDSVAQAATRVVRAVCQVLGWACGNFWLHDAETDDLACHGTWATAAPNLAAFVAAGRDLRLERRSGGLVRRAWLENVAVWAPDITGDPTFRRVAAARAADLHGAFAFPVTADGRVLGVVECYSHQIREPDAELLDCTRYLGSQIGQFCLRDTAQRRLRDSEQRFQDAAIGIARVDVAGRFVEANRWLCDLLGYSRHELLGMTIRQVSHPADAAATDAGRAGLRAGEIDSVQVEKRYLRKDGAVVWVGLMISVHRGAAGEALHDIAIIQDISARKHAEAALLASEERFRSLVELSSDWYWELDSQHRFKTFEGRGAAGSGAEIASKVLGLCRWEVPGLIADGEAVDWSEHRATLERRAPFRDFEYAYVDFHGQPCHVSVSGEPVFDTDGRFGGYRGTTRDITVRKQAEARIQYLATHDGLTGLPNRAMFSRLVGSALELARRYERQFAVLFIDLDRFKIINDSLGHEAGDALLCEVATRLTNNLRASDVVARLGGDEFVVLLPELRAPEQVALIAQKLLAAVIEPMVIHGQECRVSASIGISNYPADAQDEQTLMKHADMAMYHAKEEGKNNFQFFDSTIKSQSLERLAFETRLRSALERREFSLHYQAKLDLKTGAIAGVEALLRWTSAELGNVSPVKFIPLAEETGMILPIGKWVLRTACEQGVAWQRAGLPPMRVAVNLSPRQFSDPTLVADIDAVLRSTGMAPDLLELEITEGAVMHDTERAVAVLRALKALGVHLAIDDFGTGYSSLAQLKRFPIDTLKVDRSFIRELPSDLEDKAITGAIIAMGRTLGLTVVAEGVETEAQQGFLRDQACDQMQGYLFSRPVPADEFAALLGSYRPAADAGWQVVGSGEVAITAPAIPWSAGARPAAFRTSVFAASC